MLRALLVALLLTGCATDGGAVVTGERRAAPYGWEQHCTEELLNAPECGAR